MDVLKFIEERKRLCKMYSRCSECPARSKNVGCMLSITSEEKAEKQVELLEKWSTEHPLKTRQSVFMEKYPNATIDSQGVLCICPENLYGDSVCPKKEENSNMMCYICRKEFWTKVVK